MEKEKTVAKKGFINNIIEIAGWFGVLLILGGYWLLAVDAIHSRSWEYHVMILVGSTFVGIVSWRKRNYQPVALNIVFVLLAIVALTRLYLQ